MTLEEMQKAHAKNVAKLRQAEKDGKIKNLYISDDLSTRLVMSWRDEDGKLNEIAV